MFITVRKSCAYLIENRSICYAQNASSLSLRQAVRQTDEFCCIKGGRNNRDTSKFTNSLKHYYKTELMLSHTKTGHCTPRKGRRCIATCQTVQALLLLSHVIESVAVLPSSLHATIKMSQSGWTESDPARESCNSSSSFAT